MTLRRLTAADADRMVRLIMLHYAQMREHQARAILEDPGHPFVLFGDPDVPTLCKLQHYAPFMSPAPDVTTAKATHVSNLYPMSVEALISLGILTEDQVSPATLLLFLDQSIAPLLAESLGQLNDWSRAGAAGTERRAVSGRRVWAHLPPLLANTMKARYFPNATVRPSGIIFMNTLNGAAQAVAGLRPA